MRGAEETARETTREIANPAGLRREEAKLEAHRGMCTRLHQTRDLEAIFLACIVCTYISYLESVSSCTKRISRSPGRPRTAPLAHRISLLRVPSLSTPSHL